MHHILLTVCLLTAQLNIRLIFFAFFVRNSVNKDPFGILAQILMD